MITPIKEHIRFKAANGHVGVITYWQQKDGWYWEALGNTGKSATADGALYDAKAWIRSGDAGVSGLSSHAGRTD